MTFNNSVELLATAGTWEALMAAVDFTHERGVKLYITLNNLISAEELAPSEKFLRYLNAIQPDAILVQDLAVKDRLNLFAA